MMVVIVDIDLVAVPLPIAAAVEIVSGNHPVGAIVEDDVARAVVDRARHEYLLHVLVMAARIGTAGNDTVVLVIPGAIIGAGLLLFPAFVLAIVVAVVVAVVFVPSLVLAIFVMFIAVLRRGAEGQSTSQCAQGSPQN